MKTLPQAKHYELSLQVTSLTNFLSFWVIFKMFSVSVSVGILTCHGNISRVSKVPARKTDCQTKPIGHKTYLLLIDIYKINLKSECKIWKVF